MTFEIRRAANGWILRDTDPDAPEEIVCEERDDDETGVDAFASLLWALNEKCGPTTSRHSPKRIVIRVEHGDKYDDS